LLGGAHDVASGCAGHAEGDVFAERGAEQEGFLRHESDVVANGARVDLAQVYAVDSDCA
jgi:hypothetical protein